MPYKLGLLGHSDADVLTHAIMDALLGAAGLGDIGMLFPDTDPAYEGADSMLLLMRVRAMLAERGYRIVNIDATVVAQRPKLAPHFAAMRGRHRAGDRHPARQRQRQGDERGGPRLHRRGRGDRRARGVPY